MALDLEVVRIGAQHGENRSDSAVFAGTHSRRWSDHDVQQRVAGAAMLVETAWASQHRQQHLDGASAARPEAVFIGAKR
jgi:hypothetical protein